MLRHNLIDSAGTWAFVDLPVHDAGNFNSIMNVWIHIAVVVNGNSILSYRDSQVAPADGYGFFSGWPRDTNSAYPNPQALTSTFGAFDMHSNIHLGSRTDHNADRHFLGRMAGLTIASEAMSSGQVSCVFTATAPIPPSTSGSTTTAAQQPGGHIPSGGHIPCNQCSYPEPE
jgi:hypothetical protein